MIMTIETIEKMILKSIDRIRDTTILTFASFLHDDKIDSFLEISIKNNIITRMFFTTKECGAIKWENEKGIIEVHRKKSDVEIVDFLNLKNVESTLLENNQLSKEYAYKKIIPEILSKMLDYELSIYLNKIVYLEKNNISNNWKQIIDKNIKLTNEYIKSLLLEAKSQN